MSDNNGSPRVSAQPTALTTTVRTTAEDDAKPYKHITQISIARRKGGGYYLALGQDIPPSIWSKNKEEAIVKLVAKLYLTPMMMKLLSEALQDTLNTEDTSAEGDEL